MALVRLRGQLKRLADDRAEHAIEGGTVGELLLELERAHPAAGGWILDERGVLRRHINVFVNGELGELETRVEAEDRIDVLPAISGRIDTTMTELLVGTRKGLFVLEGEPGSPFEVTARAFAGEPVEYALRDLRSGRMLVSVTSPFYGPKIWYADDPEGDWEQADGVALPGGGEAALERIWVIATGEQDGTVYVGGDPGVLFESRDGGARFELNRGLWEHPSRAGWQPGGGGLCLHSIVTWPGEPDRLAVAISAAGVWLTDDRGATWRRGNEGVVPRYLPDPPPEDEIALCVHSLNRAASRPERMFMQFHGGVYRSDDGGETWTDIAPGLPSDFGFPLALDPADPGSAYVIPLTADTDRVTPEGRVRVYETRDAGASWTPRAEGLPPEHAYLTILRQAFDQAGDGEALELYFGATSGAVFGSGDAGASWFDVATHLPPVLSVSAGRRGLTGDRMPLRNRVTPLSQLIADPARGLVYGNRGCLHDAHGEIRRRYAGRRWIACRLRFRGWRRKPLVQPGRFTELFFLDEATALAAGHRPCALCRREDYDRFGAIWRGLHPGDTGAAAIDARLHAERVEPGSRAQRHHEVPRDGLPDGAFVVSDGAPCLMLGGELLAWTPAGYEPPERSPSPRRVASLITPPSLVAVLSAGWDPVVPLLHPSAAAG